MQREFPADVICRDLIWRASHVCQFVYKWKDASNQLTDSSDKMVLYYHYVAFKVQEKWCVPTFLFAPSC